MDIKEGNRLICAFMDRPYKFKRTKFVDNSEYEVEELPKYDSDWNELMNVVEKIEKTFVQEKGSVIPGNVPEVNIIRNTCHIFDLSLCHVSVHANDIYKSRIENVWHCVVKFIHWYNNTQTPQP